MAWAGNHSDEFDLLVVHADQLARADDLQENLRLSHRDLVIVDEAHKVSGSCFGNNVKRDQVLSARRAAGLDHAALLVGGPLPSGRRTLPPAGR